MRGTPALHASAVAVAGRAALFLAPSGGGKSTLATAFVASGLPLVSDDIVSVGRAGGLPAAHPGYPQMRLWLDDALSLIGDAARSLAPVHPAHDKRRMPVGPGGFGRFEDRTLPIGAVYVLERRTQPGPCLVEPVPGARRVIDLVRHSFAAEVVDIVGLQNATRLGVLAALAAEVPFRRLSYPSGKENLDAVTAAVIDDLRRYARS
jgi:hypothetical protein